MTGAARLEVGRIGRAHGLRGELSVTLTSDRVRAPRAGLRSSAPTTASWSCAPSRPHQQRWLVCFDGIDDRTAAEQLQGASLYADALPTEGDELWVHELIGATVQDPAGNALGVVEAIEANPASDLLVLDGERLVPLTFVVAHEPGSWSPSTCPTASGTESGDPHAHRRVHDLPRLPRRSARAVAHRPGARARRRRPAPARSARPHRRPSPHRRRHAVRWRPGHGDAARAAVRRGGGGAAAAPAAAAVGERSALRPGDGARARGRRRVLVAVRPVRGRRPARRRPPLRRRGLGRRRRARRRRGRRARDHRGGDPPAARGHGQRRVGGGGVLRRRAARVPAVHPARPSYRGWAVPEVLRSGDHARIAEWRRTTARRRTAERRPDLLARTTGRTRTRAGPATGSDRSGAVALPSQPAPTALPKDLYAP